MRTLTRVVIVVLSICIPILIISFVMMRTQQTAELIEIEEYLRTYIDNKNKSYAHHGEDKHYEIMEVVSSEFLLFETYRTYRMTLRVYVTAGSQTWEELQTYTVVNWPSTHALGGGWTVDDIQQTRVSGG